MAQSPRCRPVRWSIFLSRITLFITALLLVSGWRQSQVLEGDLTDGVWAGNAGPDVFYWELWEEDAGYGGVIHTIRNRKKETELPVSRIIWQNPELEMFMDRTGVVYRGKVDFGKGVINGRLYYGEERGPKMDLQRRSPDQVAGLRACPETNTYEPPAAGDDGLVTADARDVGLSPEAATGLVNAICAGDAGVIHSLLVLAEGKLVVEEYFHGYGRDDLHRLASVTKSISSLLVGLAIDREEISGVDAPVVDFFPESREEVGDRWQQETLRHLLTMSMGLEWGAGEGPHGTGPAFFKEVLEREVIHEPGSHWAYQSANVNLLAGVIREATGQQADAFAAQYLFDPLGIDQYDWSMMAKDGYPLMDGSLRLRPRDMAKVGLLLRDEGRWQGKQIVSSGWIRQSTAPHIDTDGPEQYGYLWWLGNLPDSKGEHSVVFANGHGSQFIAWIPEKDVILVVTGGNDDNDKHFAIAEVIGWYLG